MTKEIVMKATPHNWPTSGTSNVNEWALVVVDMQNDYCTQGCYMDKAGFNLDPLKQPIKNLVLISADTEEARKLAKKYEINL